MPFSHVSCTNFRYISSYANIEFSVRTIFYIIYIMTDRTTAFFKQYHYENLFLKVFSVVLVTGIKEANCAVRSRIFSAFKAIFFLVLVIIRIQFVNRANDFHYRILNIFVISVCADVLRDKINKGFLHISACITNTSNGELYP